MDDQVALPWSDVAKSDGYRALSPADQATAKDQYFATVVSPRVPEDKREQVKAQFYSSTATAPEAPSKPTTPLGTPLTAVAEPIAAMASGMVAKPIADVVGLGSLASEGLRRAGLPLPELDPLQIRNSLQDALTYSPRTTVGQQVTEYNPLALIGKGMNWLADKAENAVAGPSAGPLQSAVGYGVHEAVNQLPVLLGAMAPGAAAATQEGLAGGAQRVMQSALKPPLAELQKGNAARAVDTLLDQGINVTKGGVEKLKDRIDVLNTAIGDAIDNSPAVIDKRLAAVRLQGLVNKFVRQVNPLSDLAAIQSAWDEFLNHPLINGNDIPVKTAQEMKQATYRSLSGKAYGEEKSTAIEAQKTLARGLKEEIANAVPAVRELNAEESQLLNALSLTERRVLISANKNPMGLSLLTTNPAKFAGFMADRSELFKSLVARMLNSTSKAVPDLDVAGPLLGEAVTAQADRRAQ